MNVAPNRLAKKIHVHLTRISAILADKRTVPIATDRYDNPPGQQVPHHARAFVTSGPALIKALTEKEKPFICLNASNTIPAVRSIPR